MASGPDVAVAEYHIFLGSQAFQANRATGVDLVGGNADFSPQAIFETVRKASGGVDHHRTGIHLGQEPAGPGVVLGDDAVGMLGAVTVDVFDGAIQIGRASCRERVEDSGGDGSLNKNYVQV